MTTGLRSSDVQASCPTTGALSRAHPEVGAGGYSRLDGTVEFYGRVRALTAATSVVLDYGAGRGAFVEDPVRYRRDLRWLRGRVGEMVGADVDPVVRDNPSLDRAVVIGGDGRLPLADGSVDVVVCDYVLEHVTDPGSVSAEMARVLRPGGWFCARTPSKWGPIGIGGRVVPNAMHTAALARIQPQKKDADTFPTTYRLNTRHAIRAHFPRAAWDDYSYYHESELTYGAQYRLLHSAHRVYGRIAPERMRSLLMVFLQRRP